MKPILQNSTMKKNNVLALIIAMIFIVFISAFFNTVMYNIIGKSARIIGF